MSIVSGFAKSLRAAGSIASTTHNELLRGRVLYVTIFFSSLLVACSMLFASVSVGDFVRMSKDFGLFALSLFSVIFVVVAGAGLLERELQRKTIMNVLARPVPRPAFIIGKFFGLALTAVLLVGIMGGLLSLFLFLMESSFDEHLLLGYYFVALEVVLASSLVIFFSSIVVTPVLCGFFAGAAFLAGRAAPTILKFNAELTQPVLPEQLLEIIYFVLPGFHYLVVAPEVVFERSIPSEIVMFGTLYTVSYAIFVLVIASAAFGRRDFN